MLKTDQRNHFHHPFALKSERRYADTTNRAVQPKQSGQPAMPKFLFLVVESAQALGLMNCHLEVALTYKAAGIVLIRGLHAIG